MRSRHIAWLVPLAGLVSCAPLPLGQGPGQGAVQIDCRHFYRTPDGAWQGDGNATAMVNGRRWFLAISRFTPAGPPVGGVPIYNELQRQCGGVMPVAAVAPSPASRPSPGRCLADGSRTTLSGRIAHKTVPRNVGENLRGHYYARLILDHPVCVLEGGFGSVPNGKVVALLPEGSDADRFREGAHVTLTGVLNHTQSGNEPPEELQFDTAQ